MASEGADPYRGLRTEQKSESGSWTGNTTARELEGEGDRSLPAPPLKARDSAAMGQLQGDAPERDRYFAQGARGEGGRWQRGSSGNPRGRPPSERALSTILRRLLRAPAPGQEGMSAREALCLQLLTRALEGDMTAIRLVLEYTDGKPAQRVEGSMTVQMMAPFTSDEAVVAHAELAGWEQAELTRKHRAGLPREHRAGQLHDWEETDETEDGG